jgi:hypothetical protein
MGELPGFETTVAVYRSRLWLLLKPRSATRNELDAMRIELLNVFSLYQADGVDLSLRYHGVVDRPYLHDVSAREFGEGLRALSPPYCLEWLALLCVLYRLALDDLDLSLAVELRELVREYYTQVLQALEIKRFGLHGGKELEFLIEMRVLRGDTSAGPPAWAIEEARSTLSVADWRAEKAVRGRRRTDGKLVRKLPSADLNKVIEIAIGFALDRSSNRAPVVLQTADTRRLARNRPSLIMERDEKIMRSIETDMRRVYGARRRKQPQAKPLAAGDATAKATKASKRRT